MGSVQYLSKSRVTLSGDFRCDILARVLILFLTGTLLHDIIILYIRRCFGLPASLAKQPLFHHKIPCPVVDTFSHFVWLSVFKIKAIIMANTNTDFAAFQQMRRINPSKYHNQKTRKTMNATYRDVGMAEFFGIDEDA